MVYEAPSQWDFRAGDKLEGLEAYCRATCIDVPARMTIGGYSDLRDVPLLAKIRTVTNLAIDVEGMSDLRGLEHVDITDKLELQTHFGDITTFKSLDGLTDRSMGTLRLFTVYGLTELDGARFDQLDNLNAEGVGLQRLDLSMLTMAGVSVTQGNLNELKLGEGTAMGIALDNSGPLTTFSWRPLTAKFIQIVHNENLSSCVVTDFVSQTATQGAVVLVEGNGPCP